MSRERGVQGRRGPGKEGLFLPLSLLQGWKVVKHFLRGKGKKFIIVLSAHSPTTLKATGLVDKSNRNKARQK